VAFAVRHGIPRETSLKRNSLFARLAAGLAAALLLAGFVGCKSQVGGDVMATVDGRKIFRSDVDKYYDNQVASAQQAPTGEQATTLRLNILHQLIDDEILMRRAEKLGLLATDDEVERKYNEIKSPFSQQEFDQRLKDKKVTLADFKRDIRRPLTVEKVMNKEVSSKINVTDPDITNYFNAHKSEFNLIEPQYHLAQIMVTPMPNPQVHNQNNKAQTWERCRSRPYEIPIRPLAIS
jgi:peptidyl-prolyl cis-trans isomerase SurA